MVGLSVSLFIFLLAGCRTITPISSEFPVEPIRGTGRLDVSPRQFADTSYRDADSVSAKAANNKQSNGVLVAWGRFLANDEGDGASTTGNSAGNSVLRLSRMP
jgi:hypothetical protein